jgi:hypothetical protein
MTKAQPRSNEVSFDALLRQTRDRLISLSHAIRGACYFDAWLAAAQLRAALDDAARSARQMPSTEVADATRRLHDVRSLAEPMLALAPAPSRLEIRRLRTSDPRVDRHAWDQTERRWYDAIAIRRKTSRFPKE